MKVVEGDSVTLECTLTKPDVPVKWLKDGKEIQPTDSIQLVTDSYTHQLVFTEVTLKDKARYKCVVGDVSTQATLTVKGKSWCIT